MFYSYYPIMPTSILSIIKHAWAIIMKYYDDVWTIQQKADNSPVTQADIEASEYLEREFQKLFPDHVIISEEKKDNSTDYSQKIWFFDPLDGTKFFIDKQGTFSIMASRCEGGVVKEWFLYFPVSGIGYYAKQGFWCYKITEQSEYKIALEYHVSSKMGYKNIWDNIEEMQALANINIPIKHEVRPTWYLIAEFLEWKYDTMLFGHINKFEVWTMIILCQEVWSYVWHIDWESVNILDKWTSIMKPIFVYQK